MPQCKHGNWTGDGMAFCDKCENVKKITRTRIKTPKLIQDVGYRERFEMLLGLLIRLESEEKVTTEGKKEINETLKYIGMRIQNEKEI